MMGRTRSDKPADDNNACHGGGVDHPVLAKITENARRD